MIKLFDSDIEGKLPLRGVKPPQVPEETFDEIKTSLPTKDQTNSDVTYTDVEVCDDRDLWSINIINM